LERWGNRSFRAEEWTAPNSIFGSGVAAIPTSSVDAHLWVVVGDHRAKGFRRPMGILKGITHSHSGTPSHCWPR
jgi:hypothetical protein